MHKSSYKIMQRFRDDYVAGIPGENISILDVGSLDVNGSYSDLFSKYKYIGLDREKGPNVHMVPFYTYKWLELSDNLFDIVISGQAFEHIEFFWITMSEMVRVLKKGGLMCLVAPIGFKEHRYPVDCWRFLSDGMVALGKWCSLEIIEAYTKKPDSVLIARKNYSGNTKHFKTENYHGKIV